MPSHDDYRTWAQCYDKLYSDMALECARLVEKVFAHCGASPASLLDVGCGTGTLSLYFADRGLAVTGLDLSPQMVALARSKDTGGKVDFFCASMLAFTIDGTVDAAVSSNGVVSYCLEPLQLRRVFENVRACLSPGGLYVLDTCTPFSVRSWNCERVYVEEEDVFAVWRSSYDADKDLGLYRITWFLRDEGNAWRRREDRHYQRGYDVREIEALAGEAGLALAGAWDCGDAALSSVTDTTEELLVALRKT